MCGVSFGFCQSLLKSPDLIMKSGHLNPPITPKQCANSNKQISLENLFLSNYCYSLINWCILIETAPGHRCPHNCYFWWPQQSALDLIGQKEKKTTKQNTNPGILACRCQDWLLPWMSIQIIVRNNFRYTIAVEEKITQILVALYGSCCPETMLDLLLVSNIFWLYAAISEHISSSSFLYTESLC